MRERAWFAVLSSREVGRAPVGVKRLGHDLVFFRGDDGRVRALVDVCPHRRTKLSLGTVKDDCIVCPFHGFAFDETGACRTLPAHGKGGVIPKAMRADTVQVREMNGYIYMWGDPLSEPVGEPAWFPELTSRFAYSEFVEEWDTHYSRAVENQLDFAHLPFVHQTTIGRGMTPELEHTLHEEPGYLRYSSAPRGKTAPPGQGIQWRAPNVWLLTIADGFRNTVVFAPIDEERTRMYLRAYQAYVTWPILRDVVGALLTFSNKRVLVQDQRVVEAQRPKETHLKWTRSSCPSISPSSRFDDSAKRGSSTPTSCTCGARSRSKRRDDERPRREPHSCVALSMAAAFFVSIAFAASSTIACAWSTCAFGAPPTSFTSSLRASLSSFASSRALSQASAVSSDRPESATNT